MFTYENIYNLNELEIIIYNYVIEHPKEVLHMPIKELAKKTHVSTTTILRFCRTMGFSGYSEFKVRYKYFLETSKPAKMAEQSDNLQSSLKKYETAEFHEKISQAADLLLRSSGIIWLGFGSSSGLCHYASHFFSGSNKLNLVIDDPYFHLQGKIFPGAAIVVLSVSGEIDNTIRIIESLRTSECTVLSITNYADSTLAKISDFVLPYYVPYQKTNDIDITTQLPVMYIIELLGRKLLNLA